jgi:hypothetical protein
VFSEPSGGKVRFQAFGEHVMLTWGRIPTVRSLDPRFAERGTVNEDQVAVWVPVLGPDGLAMFVAYIWLDNPMSMTSGREVSATRRPGAAWASPSRATTGRSVSPRSGSRTPVTGPSFSPLLELTRQETVEETGAVPFRSLYELVSHAAEELIPGDPAELARALGAGPELLSDATRHRMRSVFLKQFPAVEGSETSALQQITETSYVIRRLRAWPLGARTGSKSTRWTAIPSPRSSGWRARRSIWPSLRDGLRRPDSRVLWPS